MSTQAETSPQMRSSSYLLPGESLDFLLRDEMRAVRFALDYAKADLILRDWRIRSTVIVFGSAGVPSPEALDLLPGATGTDGAFRQQQRQWYEAAREFGRIASLRGGAVKDGSEWRDNVIATGGGKAPQMPVVLFDSTYWRKIINFSALVDAGMVSPEHCSLFEFADSPEEAWRSIARRGLRAHG